jgi:PAS domain S-box-containing protein
MSKTSLSPLKIFAGAGATLLILLVSLVLSFQHFNKLAEANRWNMHTYEVLLETSHVLRGLVNMQTGARGFLQTREERFLDPYKNGRREYLEHFNKAVTLTRDNAEQQARLKTLDAQYRVWLTKHIDPLIAMRRATPNTSVALREAVGGVEERRVRFAQMRDTVGAIEKAEGDLLRQRIARGVYEQNLTKTILLLNGAFAIALALGLSTLLAAGAGRLEASNKKLTEEIMQRERAQREAEVLSEHNEMILQAAREGIAGLNQAGRTTFFNPAAEALTGYSASEIIGKPLHDMLHYKKADGSPYPAAECPIMSTLRDRKVHHTASETYWHKDGRALLVESTSAPLVMCDEEEDYSDEGKQVGAVVVFRDISERRKTETSLRELASIVQGSDDAIIAFKLNGAISRWNRAATKLYGYSEWEMVGQYIDQLIPPGAQEELTELLEKIRSHQPVERYETTRLRKDGSTVHVVVSLSPMLDDNGEVLGASSISREVFRDRIKRFVEAESVSDGQNTDRNNDNSPSGTFS